MKSAPVRSVLVVYKRSSRRRELPVGRAARRLRARDPLVRRDLDRFEEAGRSHRRALARVRRVLRRLNLKAEFVYHASTRRAAAHDGVISVGGDGTFLEAARGVRGQWILGVNSDPARSAGSFCAADAGSFERILRDLLRGKRRVLPLRRLELEMNGRPMGVRVLNDLLITHRRPAAMSRYWLRVGSVKEEQRSSGLWIATAAGSTGAVRSAGGRALPRASGKLQVRPRELYRGTGFRPRLTGGVVEAGRPVEVGSLMPRGMICADGEHWTAPFGYGDRLRVLPSPDPLHLVL